MEKEEILEKTKSKKCVVGEMEKEKMGKCSFIALIVAGVMAVIFIIIEGLLAHFEAIYALSAVCFGWACVFYFCQYFIAKRPKGVLIGAVLEGLACIGSVVMFILYSVGVI